MRPPPRWQSRPRGCRSVLYTTPSRVPVPVQCPTIYSPRESGCGSLQRGTDGRHGFIRTCCHDCRRHCCFLPPRERVCVCVWVWCATEVACAAAGDGADDLHLYFNFFVFIIINWVQRFSQRSIIII